MISYSRLLAIRRLCCQYARKLCVRTRADGKKVENATSPSSLYIKHDDLRNVRVIQLNLNLSKRLADVQSIEANLMARGMKDEINIRQLVRINIYNISPNSS